MDTLVIVLLWIALICGLVGMAFSYPGVGTDE